MSAREWARGALDTLGYPRAATFELEQEHLIHASTWIEDRKVRDDRGSLTSRAHLNHGARHVTRR